MKHSFPNGNFQLKTKFPMVDTQDNSGKRVILVRSCKLLPFAVVLFTVCTSTLGLPLPITMEIPYFEIQRFALGNSNLETGQEKY